MGKLTETEHEEIQRKSLDLYYKLKGISELISNYSPEGMDSEREEQAKFIGIGLIIEGLGNEAKEIFSTCDKSSVRKK